MNFLIITLALLISQSIASEEEERSVSSREAVIKSVNLTRDGIEDVPNVHSLLIKDAIYDSELVKADRSHELRFDRALSSDVDVDESLTKAADEIVEAKSASKADDDDVSKSGDNASVEKAVQNEDASAAFLRDVADLERTEEVNISKRADDDENMKRVPQQDESIKILVVKSAERSDQHDDVEKAGAEGLKIFKSRRMLDDDILDFKARSGHVEETQSENVRSALLDDMKLLQNFNPLDSRNTYPQLNPVVDKQLFRSFATVPPPQLFKLSSQERPLAAFQNYLPSKSPFNLSPELGNQFNRFGFLSSKERVQNPYPFQPFLTTTQRSLPNMPITNFKPSVNDFFSKFAKPTDALSNFNLDFPQRSLFHNQQFMPQPLLQRFPRFIPIQNRLRPYN